MTASATGERARQARLSIAALRTKAAAMTSVKVAAAAVERAPRGRGRSAVRGLAAS